MPFGSIPRLRLLALFIVSVASAATSMLVGGCGQRPLPLTTLDNPPPPYDAGAEAVDGSGDGPQGSIDAPADVPDVPPTLGDVSIHWIDASPIQLLDGAAMFFRFVVQSTVPHATTVALAARLSVPGWTSSLFDQNLDPLPASGIAVDARASAELWVRVDPVPDQLGESFMLAVDGTAAPLSATTGWLGFTIGQIPAWPDGSHTILPGTTNLGPGVTFDGSTVTARPGSLASFTFKFLFIQGGDGFSVSVREVGGASGWGPFLTSGIPTQIAPNTTRSLGFGIGMGATGAPHAGYIRFDVLQNGNAIRSILVAVAVAPSP